MSLKPLSSFLFVCFVVFISGCTSTNNSASLAISISVTPQFAAISPGQSVQLTATVTNSTTGLTSVANSTDESSGVRWSATAGKIDEVGNYTAPTGTQNASVYVIATSKQDRTKFANALIHVVSPGKVTSTANAQVALYTIASGTPANVSVEFGPDTNYGLKTWAVQSVDGGPVSLYVAGMKGNTAYHMRAVAQFPDGSQFMDADQTFTTSAGDPSQNPAITANTPTSLVPQSGVELLALVSGSARPTITDLSGNVLWTYAAVPGGLVPNPIKLLSNGHFLINFSNSAADGADSILQEVDLAGNLIWQMTAAQLNKALASATCSGCNITVVGTHHDFVQLPNGHLIVIAATQQVVSGTTVTGDVLIDLDQNHNPVWLWNEFDHLDINRRPYLFPDWTHTNAVIYSPDDGNLIISMRHQNWLVKIDYANGSGAGNILWHLGYQGDFTLIGGTDPTDWFYAQHGPSFASPNTTGNYSLVLFDDGDDRVFPSGVTCGSPGEPACFYSTVPLLHIDETAMTATLTFHPTAAFYSFFGGNAEVLANGNVEFCVSAGGSASNSGEIYEVTPDSTAQTVWQMQVSGEYAYRGQRIPSFYPGVQW